MWIEAASGLERQRAKRGGPPRNQGGRQTEQPLGFSAGGSPAPRRLSPPRSAPRRPPARAPGRARGGGGEGSTAMGGAERPRARLPPARSSRQLGGRGDYITCAAPPLREDVACSLAPGESPRLPHELGERNWRRSTPGGSALQQEPTSSRSRSRRPGRKAVAAAATSGRVSGAEFEPAPSGESGPSP